MEVTVGADPEVFLKDGTNIVSIEGLIPGTKEEPFKVPGGAIQKDGLAAEFNIDPASTADEFNANIVSVMAQLKDMAGPRYEFIPLPSVKFPRRILEVASPAALRLGCEPDFNLYTRDFNPAPRSPDGVRSAGGHIHLGWGEFDVDSGHFHDCCELGKWMDHFIGIPSLVMDDDRRRRTLYGKSGAIRVKPYGMEYRTPSNFWIFSEARRRWAFKAAKTAFEAWQHLGVCPHDPDTLIDQDADPSEYIHQHDIEVCYES